MNWINAFRKEVRAISPTQRQIRQFGWLFFVVFTFGVPAWKAWHTSSLADVEFTVPLLGVFFLAAAYLFPSVLNKPYRWWMGLGLLMGLVVGNAVVAVVFYLVMTPIGLINRVRGKHFMPLKPDARVSTYWITREKAFTKTDFERQF
jgi:glucan phosphoethanolaminetransferase (alkaline phosphatase superfamily)